MFVALTRPQMFAGVTYSFFVINTVIAVELFSAVVHPFPAGFGGTKEEVCQHVERYPQWVLGVIVPAWAISAFAGIWTARSIGNL